jgi:phosphoesterase RecJ-like protein
MSVLEIHQALENANKIGITAHIRPDGDAIGSLIGLGLALQNNGKQVQLVLRDGVSNTFRHLIGANQIVKSFSDECDIYIAVDCSDLRRTGEVLKNRVYDICIDHHITNERYARINLIDPDAVATSAILAELLPQLGLTIDQPIASALLTGILSDSIGFRTSNTNIKALKLAVKLMEAGADIYSLYNKALITRPFEAAKYWGYGLSKLERRDGLAWTSLSLEDRKNAGYQLNDDADLTNVLSSIENCDISILFVEQSKELTKVSWRARPGLDVTSLASSYGGGGHPAASGAECKGSLQEVQDNVLSHTLEYLTENKKMQQEEIRGKMEEIKK